MPIMQVNVQEDAMGNLFKLAEKKLQTEVVNRKRKNYDLLDIVDYAVMVRKHLDYQNRAEKIAKAKRKKNA